MQKIVKWLREHNFAVFGINSDWGTIPTPSGVSLIQRDTLEQPLKDCQQILEITEYEVLVRSEGKVGIYSHKDRKYHLPLAHRTFPQTEVEVIEAYNKGFIMYQEDGKFGLYEFKFSEGRLALSGYDSIQPLIWEKRHEQFPESFFVQFGDLAGEYSRVDNSWTIPLRFNSYDWFPKSYIARVSLNDKFGAWDADGSRLMVPVEFDSIDMINEREGTFTVTQGGRVGIYNTTNDKVSWQ